MLADRDHQLGEIIARADDARAGRGGLVFESAGSPARARPRSSTFIDRSVKEERVLRGACRRRPLDRSARYATSHRLAPATQGVLAESDAPYDIFEAVYEDLRIAPSVLVRGRSAPSPFGSCADASRRRALLAVGIVRDDEVGVGHPLRVLLGDAARSPEPARSHCPCLASDAVGGWSARVPLGSRMAARFTGGNAFFVRDARTPTWPDTDLPTTVRDRAAVPRISTPPRGCAEPADVFARRGARPALTDLGVTLPALWALSDAGLTRRIPRGVAFRHDLCRMAVSSVYRRAPRPACTGDCWTPTRRRRASIPRC